MTARLKHISLTIFQRFFRIETVGGLVLLAFGLAVLAIANSLLAETYDVFGNTTDAGNRCSPTVAEAARMVLAGVAGATLLNMSPVLRDDQ